MVPKLARRLILSLADIKLDNLQEAPIMDDELQVFTELVEAERNDPGPRNIVDEHLTIYSSRNPSFHPNVIIPIVCDLGSAVYGQNTYHQPIQPLPYRAPEVILGMGWNEKVDIWNLGIVVSERFGDY
jgi:serine/threonine protein kinase